jgi:hypothetical protein
MPREMLGCCGLNCAECGAYLATQANDAKKAAEVAKEWAATFHVEVEVENVWCDGCTWPGKKCAHCAECEMRACAMGKKVENCGKCPEFDGCKTIGAFLAQVPPAKANLERVRSAAR